MAQDASTKSKVFAIRNWLEAADNSTNSGWDLQARDLGATSEDDIPKATPILARRRLRQESHDCEDESARSVTDMHLQDLTQLSACFFDMDVMFRRVSRDFDHFSSRMDAATQVILKNPELPGIDVLAALKATSLILRNTVATNISDISDFMDMLSGIMQTMEGIKRPTPAKRPAPVKEPAFWAPSSEVDAWNIALPSDDLFETDAPQEPSTRPNKAYTIKYHDDIKDIDSPRLYVSRSSSAHTPGPQSRRVILDNLPSDITTSQVLRSIRCYGGTMSAVLTNSLSKASAGTKTAVIEFVYPGAAADVVSHLHNSKLAFLDSKGEQHQPEVYLIPTPSYFHTEVSHCLLDRGCTRALFMPGFPEGAIWHLLRTIGTKHIDNVQLSKGHLTVELTSLFEANRAEKQIRFGTTGIAYNAAQHGMRYIPDSSQGETKQDNHSSHGRLIAFTDPDDLQISWDREPYNTYGAQNPQDTPAVAHPSKPTHEDILAEYFSVDPSEVWSYLEDRRTFQATTYNIVGSTIKLTRHKWSWAISAEDDLKLLMANTLHDPDWAAEWDEYFAARGMVNLRKCEEYSLLAKHRRERAAEQGLAQGMVPTCSDCPWGCRSLKKVPSPRFIRDYIARERVDAEEV